MSQGIRTIAGYTNNYPVVTTLSGTAKWNTTYILGDISSLNFTVPAYNVLDGTAEIRVYFTTSSAITSSIDRSNFTTVYGLSDIEFEANKSYELSFVPLTSTILTVIGLANDVVISIPRDGLLVEWLFDDMTSSVVTDTSGNNNNGTITGTITQEEGYVGYSGRCSVNDTTNKVTCAISASEFSASFWFKSNYTDVSQLTTNTQMVGIMAISGYYCQMYATKNGTVWYCDAGDNGNSTGLSTTDNTWHHIVITHGTSWGLYVDGVSRTAVGYYVASVNEGIALFNNRGTLNQSGNVNIDQFRFYNRVLTTDEITALYQERL